MREIDGLSYADLAAALDVTVPAVKSLLVRARVGLVEAQESRDADCGEIRRDLMASYDRGVKASGRARRHMRECAGCREYRQRAASGVRRSFAALAPVGAGPRRAAGQAARRGGGGGPPRPAAAAAPRCSAARPTATACKVAAVVCATAITAGGAVEVRKLTADPAPKRERAAAAAAAAPRAAPAPIPARPTRPWRRCAPLPARAARPARAPPQPRREQRRPRRPTPAGRRDRRAAARRPSRTPGTTTPPVTVDDKPQVSSGGTRAPEETASPADRRARGRRAPPDGRGARRRRAPPGAEPRPRARPGPAPAQPGGGHAAVRALSADGAR